MIELSVVIPCLDAAETIATQLDALCDQHWPHPWEVVVSDNGSTDASPEVVHRYESRLPQVRVVDSSGRRRQSHALNVGVRAAAGRALAFCDADDEVAPGWVAAMGDALAEHDFVAGQPCFDRFNTREEAEYCSRLWERGLYTRQFLPHAGAGNIGIRRAVHDAIGGFDENLPRFADGDYSWRLQLAGYTIHYEPRARYQYRIARVSPSLRNLFRRGWTAPAADYWTYKKYRSIGVTKDMIVPSSRTMKKSLVRSASHVRAMPRAFAGAFLRRDSRVIRRWIEGLATVSGEVFGQFLGLLRNPCTPFPPEKVRITLPFDKSPTR